ncbi:hypothetical protein MWU59_12365 [Flavobacteriaceae bacterium F08102]|nr:hypothetical protein [Flavobacteriaceae bacterium F08102]
MSYIEFKRERDIGSIIGDTFKFIRENWKSYFLAVIKIAGPFILLGAFVLVVYMSSMGDDFQNISEEKDPNMVFETLGALYAKMGVYSIVSGFVYVLISLTSIFYIKSYINNNGVTNYTEIRKNTFTYIWKFLGLGMLIALISFVGFALCVLPGIYFIVVFSLATSIMVFEKKSISDSLNHCFYLIKGQWWNTFGSLFVVGVLVSILGWTFSIPSFIYTMIHEMLGSTAQNPIEVYGILKDPVYLGLNILSNVGSFVLSSVSFIASVFIYFDLNEQKNLTGTMERIDNLGQ